MSKVCIGQLNTIFLEYNFLIRNIKSFAEGHLYKNMFKVFIQIFFDKWKHKNNG